MISSRFSISCVPGGPQANDQRTRVLASFAASAALLTLCACGGGSGSGSDTGTSTGTTAPAPDTTRALTASGSVQGVKSGDVVSFKGIPYAAAPVGSLRWRPPQPVAPWTTERQASQFGNNCMQPTSTAPSGNPVSEDCLYLNVWRPAAATQAAPVMVWIHGGGYVGGGSSATASDGVQLAKQGVVVVTLNYRLGRFGFFGHPALSAAAALTGEPLGNYGYLDQIAALRWVKQNIAAFGGNPDNVTIFGESAGGESIHNLVTSPAAANLFHKAINESGNGRVNQAFGRYLKPNPKAPLASAEEQGVTFAQQFGIAGTDATALAALRALTAEQVTDNLDYSDLSSAHGVTTFAGGAIIDGTVVLEEPQELYKSGRFNRVPMLLGVNDADLGFTKPAATKDEALALFGPEKLAAARAAFDPRGTATVDAVRSQVATVITMHEPARFVARSFAAQNVPAYLYRYAYVPDSRKAVLPGATHGIEIPFVFNTVDAVYGSAATDRDRQVARTVSAYWVAFAKTGQPAPTGLVGWPAFSLAAENLLEFTSAGGVQALQLDPLQAQLDLVQPLNEKNLTVNRQYGL